MGSARVAGESFVQSHAFEWLSRAGFVARALIYGIIGILALKLALGNGGKLTNQQGALHTVARQPFGKLLLTLVAIGLGGYSLWRLVRAGIGHGREGSDTGFDRIADLRAGLPTEHSASSRSKSCWGAAAEGPATPRKPRRESSAGLRASGLSASLEA